MGHFFCLQRRHTRSYKVIKLVFVENGGQSKVGGLSPRGRVRHSAQELESALADVAPGGRQPTLLRHPGVPTPDDPIMPLRGVLLILPKPTIKFA